MEQPEIIPDSPEPAFTIRDLLQIRNFRFLWLGQIVSNFGDALTRLTLILMINELTDGSTSAIAGLLIAMTLPQATLGLIAGVFVDRFDRKRTMIISDFLRGLLVLGFILTTLLADGNLWLIYLIAFLHSTLAAFFMPARSALIPNIVPQKGLLAANSLAQMSMVFFHLLGTAVAGVLVGVLENFWVAFTVDALTFFLSIFFIAFIQAPKSARLRAQSETAASLRHIVRQLGAGLLLLVQNRILVGTMLGVAITMLGMGGLNVLLAPFIINDLNFPATWFGAIEFAQTSAMILSGTAVALLAAKFKPTNIISVGLIGVGLVILPIAFINQVWQLFPILFVVGLMMTPLQASVATLVQTEVEDEMRGRISAALNALIQTASLVSMFAAGTAAAVLGVRNVFGLSGLITIVAGLVTILIFRGYQKPAAVLEEGDPVPFTETAVP